MPVPGLRKLSLWEQTGYIFHLLVVVRTCYPELPKYSVLLERPYPQKSSCHWKGRRGDYHSIQTTAYCRSRDKFWVCHHTTETFPVCLMLTFWEYSGNGGKCWENVSSLRTDTDHFLALIRQCCPLLEQTLIISQRLIRQIVVLSENRHWSFPRVWSDNVVLSENRHWSFPRVWSDNVVLSENRHWSFPSVWSDKLLSSLRTDTDHFLGSDQTMLSSLRTDTDHFLASDQTMGEQTLIIS